MIYRIKRKEGASMIVTMDKKINDTKNGLIDFNDFLLNNKQKINDITPLNPLLSKDDEWRNEDYSEYEGEEKN